MYIIINIKSRVDGMFILNISICNGVNISSIAIISIILLSYIFGYFILLIISVDAVIISM